MIRSSLDLIALLAICFGISGSYYLIRSVINTSAKQISEMADTYIGGNPRLREAFVAQKIDSLSGFTLTLLSGLFWLIDIFIDWHTTSATVALVHVLASLAIMFTLSHAIYRFFQPKLLLKVNAISFAFHLKNYLEDYNISRFEPSKLIQDAKIYALNELLEESNDHYDNLAKIMRFAGANPGADRIIELKNTANLHRDKDVKKPSY